MHCCNGLPWLCWVVQNCVVLLLLLLAQGLEGCEPVVLIVDDSSAVWPNDRRNLFIVERYIYFPSSRKRLGMQGKSLLEVDRWGGGGGLRGGMRGGGGREGWERGGGMQARA